MKKYTFYVTAIFCAATIFAQAEYSISSVSTTATLPCFTLKTATKAEKTNFSSAPEFCVPVWGICAYAKQGNFSPICIQAGKITPGGAFSKLKSPSLNSSSSALGSGNTEISMLKTYLPSASTSEKPFAVSGIFKTPKTKFINNFGATFYTTEGNEFLISAVMQIKTSKKTGIGFSATAGNFLIENSTSSWFCRTPIFPAERRTAINLQCGFSSPFFKTKETVNIFETASFPNFTFSTENRIALNGFSFCDFALNAAFFCASEKVVFTANSSRLKTLCQIKINPQFTFFPPGNRVKIQSGAIFLAEQKLKSDESVFLNKKVAAQINFAAKKHQAKLSLSANGENLDESFSANLSVNSKIRLKPAETFSFSRNEKSEKTTFKFSQKIYFAAGKTQQNINASVAVCAKKSGDTTLEAETKANFKFKAKFLNIACSAGIAYKTQI